MGFTDTKPFSRAGQFRLIAMLTAAVFCLCVKAVWHESTLLTYARGEMTLDSALNPDGRPVPVKRDPAAEAMGIDFTGMAPPTLWLVEQQTNTWILAYKDPANSELASSDNPPRTMGPFQVHLWTAPTMGLWASTSNQLDHQFHWWGNEQHDLSMKKIRGIIASQWTTGGQRAINTFASSTLDDPVQSASPRLAGWAFNALSIGVLLATFGFGFASFLVSNRVPLQDAATPTNAAAPATSQGTAEKSLRDAA